MTRLLIVELVRLLCRRAIVTILVAGVILAAVIGAATALNSRPPSATAVADAEHRAAQEADGKSYQRDYQRCREFPAEHLNPPLPDDIDGACAEMNLPKADWYIYWDQLELESERDGGSGFAVVVVLAILMLLAGATFAGHDWASGSMSNQLLFESRRARIWVAKAAVVTSAAGLFAAIVVSLYWLGLAQVARSRDLPAGGALVLDCLQSGWRGAGVVAGAALAGYALTMLLRSTVGALGVLLAVTVAGGVVLAVLGIDPAWDPRLNISAVILDGAAYWIEEPCVDAEWAGETCSRESTLPIGRALWYLGTSLSVFLAASLASFHRRDAP